MHHCPDCYRSTAALGTIALRCDVCVEALIKDMQVPAPRKPGQPRT